MIKYKKLVIFYFSGTGNAKRVSEWIARNAENKGITSQILNIATLNISELPEINRHTLLGFCAPTHGFNFPPVMMNFIFKFKKGLKSDVFIINTRAGLKMHKLFIPGLSGLAQILSALILWIKGYRIVGMQPMDMPSNWISLHPGVRKKVADSIVSRCKRITNKFSDKLLAGSKKYKALLSLPFDLAVVPIAVMYYFVGRFGLSKTFIASAKCNACGLCMKECPVKAIRWLYNKPYWTFNCESCMHCMNHCPKRAVETALGFTILIWWGIFSFVPVGLLWFIGQNGLIIDHPFLSSLVYTILFIGISLIIIFMAYYLVHYLLRYSFFNKIIYYTSLSRFKWWRRYVVPED